MDFGENEDEDTVTDNLNGEENEETRQSERSGLTDETKELTPTDAENAEQKDPRDY
jgi:hypothetical protein